MLILIQNNDLGISCVVEQSLFTFLTVLLFRGMHKSL